MQRFFAKVKNHNTTTSSCLFHQGTHPAVDLAYVLSIDIGAQIHDQLVDIGGCMRVARSYAIKLIVMVLSDDMFLLHTGEQGSCSEVLWAVAWMCGEYCRMLPSVADVALLAVKMVSSESRREYKNKTAAPLPDNDIKMQPARGTRGRGVATHGTRGCGVAATSSSTAASHGNTPGKKSQPNNDGPPSGSDKGKIHAVITKHIFEKDEMYKSVLKGKYKTNCVRFKQTGARINPEDPGAAVSLLVQVLNDFPCTHDLEDEHVNSATNPLCSIEDKPPNDITDPVIDDDFTMGEELDYDGHEQQLDTMQEDQAAASEYKIAKVNALCQECDLNFQCKRAELECTEAVILHQYCQEAKSLDLQVLEAQAKVHAERTATL
ncbi:hypothetical protein EDD22DRAFT_849186 [Suillus occidentalis]|nr:hypothetical protein EDD22DRAFT_849186 [Suillus occidentalis]